MATPPILVPELSRPQRMVDPMAANPAYSAKGSSPGRGIPAAQILTPNIGVDSSARDTRQNSAAMARQMVSDVASAQRAQAQNDALMNRALMTKDTQEAYYKQIGDQYQRSHDYKVEQDILDRSDTKAMQARQNEAMIHLVDAQNQHQVLADTGHAHFYGKYLEGLTIPDDFRKKNKKLDEQALLKEYANQEHIKAKADEFAANNLKNALIASENRVKVYQTAVEEGVTIPQAMFAEPGNIEGTGGDGGTDFNVLDPGDLTPEDHAETTTASTALNEVNAEINEERERLRSLLQEAGSRGMKNKLIAEAERSPISNWGADLGKLISGPVLGLTSNESRLLEHAGMSPFDASVAAGVTDPQIAIMQERAGWDPTRDWYGGRAGMAVADSVAGAFTNPVDTAKAELDKLTYRRRILEEAR